MCDEDVHCGRDRVLRHHLLPGGGERGRPREGVGDREERVSRHGTRLLGAVVGDVERAAGVEVEAAERVEAGGHGRSAAAVQPDDPLAAGAEGALANEDRLSPADDAALDGVRGRNRVRRVPGRGDDRGRRGTRGDARRQQDGRCLRRCLH